MKEKEETQMIKLSQQEMMRTYPIKTVNNLMHTWFVSAMFHLIKGY